MQAEGGREPPEIHFCRGRKKASGGGFLIHNLGRSQRNRKKSDFAFFPCRGSLPPLSADTRAAAERPKNLQKYFAPNFARERIPGTPSLSFVFFFWGCFSVLGFFSLAARARVALCRRARVGGFLPPARGHYAL